MPATVTVTVFHVFSAPPAGISVLWHVFNAPRPLPGHRTWQGDFHHGLFYAAVNPAAPDAARLVEQIADLDGWLCFHKTHADVQAWLKRFALANDLDLAHVAPDEALRSYFHHHEPAPLILTFPDNGGETLRVAHTANG